MNPIHAVVFDLGEVLIDWNPRYLYGQLFDSSEEMEQFLDTICTPEWNAQQDAGRPFRDAVALLQKQHPEFHALIEAYHTRWEEMLGDANHGSVDLLRRVKKTTLPVYALTNWSHEKFPIARGRFDFLNWFDGIVVSGEEKLKKPDLAIYQVMLERYRLEPQHTLFIDDSLANVEAARQLGIQAIHFHNAIQLEQALQEYRVI